MILIGILLENCFCFPTLKYQNYFSSFGIYWYCLENYWKNSFKLPSLVHWNNFPIVEYVNIGLENYWNFECFFQCWHIWLIFHYWQTIILIGILVEVFFCQSCFIVCFASLGILNYYVWYKNYWYIKSTLK